MNVLRLIPEQGGAAIVIDQDLALIGRDPASDIHLRDASVSRQHAEIQRNDDEWVIMDRKSGNGVRIDEVRTDYGVLLPGQRLQIGNVPFRVEIDRGEDGATVILGRRPLAGGPSKAASIASERSSVLLAMTVVVGGLVVVLFGLAALYLSRRPAPRSASPPTAPRLITSAPPPTPNPVPATAAPAPEPVRRAAPPRGALLISSDTAAEVFVDGRRRGAIPAGGMQSVEVMPGEHIVSFRVGATSHDQVVRTNANEQAVVRLTGSDTAVSAASPSPTPVAAPPSAQVSLVRSAEPTLQPQASPLPVVRTAVVSTRSPPPLIPPTPAPVSTPPSLVRSTPSPSASQRAPDEGLLSGIAATARGDFFRALLILRDVARRLESDPQARKELARTHAYLAWTYDGLDRREEAKAAAEKALQVDPGVVAGLNGFPDQVRSLFKRAR